jgi:hypothetical protein
MMKPAGSIVFSFVCLISAALQAAGQSVPVQTGSPLYSGFELPKVAGTLRYSVSGSERVSFGSIDQNGNLSSATISGNLGLITPSVTKPTTVTYSAGYLITTGGSQPSQFFNDLLVSQGYNKRHWKIKVTDSFRYLPDTPAAGLSGIAGVGDLGATAPGTPSQAVLIPYATRIENSVNGDINYVFTGKTSATGTVAYNLERFPGYTGGLQYDVYAANGNVIHRLDARTSIGGAYHYSHFTYVSYTGSFDSQGADVVFKRQLSRNFLIALSGGPQIISGSSLTHRPDSVSYAADLSATYIGSVASGLTATVSYKRSANGGSGLTFGAINDTVSGSLSRRITRSLQFSALGTYAHATGLQLITNNQITSKSTVGSLQVNRAIRETFSIYLSYTAQDQSLTGSNYTGKPLTGLRQVVGVGVTYSPRVIHLGR